MRIRNVILISAVLACASLEAFARGGGGCIAEGTSVLTPGGQVGIESLRAGDEVIGVLGGQPATITVRACVQLIADSCLRITAGGESIDVTPEHPFLMEDGRYRQAGALKVGDEIQRLADSQLRPAKIESIEVLRGERRVYNLTVFPGGSFVAGGFAVHNKGCFLPETPVLLADGSPRMISQVRVGDELLALTPEGKSVITKVNAILTADVESYLQIVTARSVLHVTNDHPFYVGGGEFHPAGTLTPGESVYAYDGDGLSRQQVLSVRAIAGKTKVYNLQTDWPNTFFAGGIAVHNKGGGGGGCFPAGTQIVTPDGDRAIESLKAGDVVIAVDAAGRARPVSVRKVFELESDLLRITTDCGVIETTAGHPVAIAGGEFRAAAELVRGDQILRFSAGRVIVAKVQRVEPLGSRQKVYNLHVDSPHTFLAGGFVVHNKGGGCFSAGTMILTPRGETAIERIRPGRRVLSIAADGSAVPQTVLGTFESFDQLLVLVTDLGEVSTTAEHPFMLASGAFIEAGKIHPGQKLLQWRDGRAHEATVLAVRPGARQLVYNLTVDGPHTFVAGGFVVHNKGGGFSGGRSSYHGGGSHGSSSRPSGGAGDATPFLVILGIGGGILVIYLIARSVSKGSSKEENLDFVYSAAQVAPKLRKTQTLLEFISKVDQPWQEADLKKLAGDTFKKLQQCWQDRMYDPMRGLLMPDLYAEHLLQLSAMKNSHEINRIENLNLERVDIVNVRYTEKPDEREFTALIAASALDYYVDDRTNRFLRGDRIASRFQEFWTFQLQGGKFLLRQIEQTGESDVLKEENFFEAFTDTTLQQVYGKAASAGGPAGPWTQQGAELKETRVERLLNFLAKIETRWDRQSMLERSREVFIRLYAARQCGDIGRFSQDATPEFVEALTQRLAADSSGGMGVEYRNLCIRKVQLVLVRNFRESAKDEFVVRVYAHAQKVKTRSGSVVYQDEYVKPFEEYLTFAWRDGKWKLKEILPPAQGAAMEQQENVDEDSNPAQMKWYYSQNRAN